MRRPLSVSRQLALSFVLLLAILAGVSLAAWLGLARTNGYSKTLYDDRVLPLEQLAEVQRLGLRDRILVMDMIRDPQPSNIERRSKEIGANREAAAKFWSAYAQTFLTPDEKALADQYPEAHRKYVTEGIEAASKLMQAGDATGAGSVAGGQLSAASPAYFDLLEKLIALQVNVAAQLYADSQASFSSLKVILSVSGVLGVAVGVAAGGFITRRLTRQLGAEPAELCSAANAIAAGDLTHAPGAGAAAGSVMDAVHRMRSGLVGVVSVVRTGVDNVASASSQISLGNADLSSRTEEQASSLQQTAASIEELTGTVASSANNARQALEFAADASTAATQGAGVVQNVVSTMADIAASSARISDIISVIDGIAFQTNILALNAAVEAARAGEQGRGFAVVASEVRTLAQRSAAAAKEIKALITTSAEVIDAGSGRAQAAGDAMHGITQRVQKVAMLLSELATSAAQQSSGIGQINQAVASIDQTTQSNAALVEESAAAAESLKTQAARLADAVATFRLPHAA